VPRRRIADALRVLDMTSRRIRRAAFAAARAPRMSEIQRALRGLERRAAPSTAKSSLARLLHARARAHRADLIPHSRKLPT